jgi:predicted transcriptional regulator
MKAAVRVSDVMSSPVVCVPPDMRVKEVADLLAREQINAVPVVDHGALVGIVCEAYLVALELAPDPRAHLIPPPIRPSIFPRWPPRRRPGR